MTSEAHRLETPPSAVSVKARAQEIEARAVASGKGPTPPAPKDEQQISSSSTKQPRRCSEGDIFLRCKPRPPPPPVLPKQRRVSLEQTTLPTVPERRTTLSSVFEKREHDATTVPTTSACQTSNFAPFTSRSDVTDDFSPAIFSRSLPVPQHSPLDDIINALEKICDEFTLPETKNCKKDTEGVSRQRNSSTDLRVSFQRGNDDDVFDEKQTALPIKPLETTNDLSHSLQCHADEQGSAQEAVCQPVKASATQFFSKQFNYVNPTFILGDSSHEPEPILYCSTLQFTPKLPQERHAVSTELQLTSPRYGVERSVSTCSDTVSPPRNRENSVALLLKIQSQEICSKQVAQLTPGESVSPFLSSLKHGQKQVSRKDYTSTDEDCHDKADIEPEVRKPVVAFKPDLPKVLTSSSLSTDSARVKNNNGTRRDSSPSKELEVIKNILANLDFDKYKRRLSLETDRKASDMEERSPKTQRDHQCSSGKFKDLFDLLKPNSGSSSSSNKRPFGLCRSSSFSNTEENTYIKDEVQDKSLPDSTNKMSTLPRKKLPANQPLKKNSPHTVMSCPSIMKLESSTEAHPADLTHDEGLVMDSEAGPGAYVTAYVNCVASFHNITSGVSGHCRTFSDVTSSIPIHLRCSSDSVTSDTPGHVRSISDIVKSNRTSYLRTDGDVTYSQTDPVDSLLLPEVTTSVERLWPTLPTEKQRKRRKGIGAKQHPGGVSAQEYGTVKFCTGRSLTYPPQRKSSASEEEQEFMSVDSNGLKSLKLLKAGLMRPDSIRLLSDLSLADSQLCASECTVDETYQDVVDSVLHSPSDPHQYLAVNGKPHKKKHHSDPGGDASSPTASETLIADSRGTSRSEPELGVNEATPSSETQTSGPVDSEEHPQLKLLIDGQGIRGNTAVSGSLTSGAIPSSRFLFPDLNSSGPQRLPTEVSKSPQEQRRYSKRRLRGPYGEMLEEEMRKSGEKQKTAYSDLSFLEGDTRSSTHQDASTSRPAMFLSSQSLDDASSTSCRSELSICVAPKRKISANYPLLSDRETVAIASDEDISLSKPPEASVQRDTAANSSLQQKSEKDSARTSSQDRNLDTRTHVVYEILETERSYVDSLQTLVTKYMGALKSTDYNGVVEGGIVDEIFFQVPEILNIHEDFLDTLSHRCSNWDAKFTIGDLFIEAFTKQQVIDTYTAFINNWKCAKDATKIATQAKPAFARFLEYMSREHKGKLALDALLIMPVQRIPRYELLIKELLKHTPMDHPDHHLLIQAQKEVHDLAVKINRVEREAFQIEQMQQRVREIEHHIDGVMDLCIPDRAFIRHDVVTIPGGLGTKKERCLFLFSDVLLITSIKKKSTAMRKPSSTAAPSTSQSPFSVLDSNKYKLLTRFSLESMEISKSTDVSLKKAMRDIATLEEDIHILNQIKELVDKISSPHQTLEDVVRDLTNSVSKQMLEKQNNDYSLISLEMTVTTQERIENLTIQFTSPERRAVWSAAFNEAKQKLGRRPPPELKKAMPIRKTRAGLQFTCATATLGYNQQGLREVWVCNSDGYVGQVCVLSLLPEPTVMSCNGVCNARILTIASIPATCTMIADKNRWRTQQPDNTAGVSIEIEEVEKEGIDDIANNGNIQLDSDSSDEDDDTESTDEDRGRDENRKRGNSIPREEGQEDMDIKQPTMWLGTEDGCVHVYNCNDNIRTKKNKIKIQHIAAIQCIIYLDNRVFVSIANGEIHIYKKETDGGWCTYEPQKVTIGSSSAPVTIMLAVAGKLWCGCQNSIHVLNTGTLLVEHSFAVSSDTSRYVLCMVTSGLGVWVTVTPSAVIRFFHATNYEPLLDVNVAPTVAKILSAATDDIIKQHKSACLRVTAMLACKDLLWIGTSAGVILTLPLPHLTSSTLSVDNIPPITGLPHGHTGHVRFLTSVEMSPSSTLDTTGCNKYSFRSTKTKDSASGRRTSTTASAGSKLLVISGGDGYEDFETTGLGEQAGHDDSTNHLLLWHV